jgi:RIO kinase 2
MYDGTAHYLIDWPQWVERDHPNAGDILAKDIGNVLRYFGRRYRVKYGQEEAVRFVTG